MGLLFNLQKKKIRALACSHYKAHKNICLPLQPLKIGVMYASNVHKSISLQTHVYLNKLLLSKMNNEYAKSMLYYQLPIIIDSKSKLILDKIVHALFLLCM